jgi:hypothetical protein
MAPPFNLPKPDILFSEGLANSQKSLGIWRVADLP